MRHGWACLPRGNAEKSNMADLIHGRFTYLRGEAHGKLTLSLHQEETKKTGLAANQLNVGGAGVPFSSISS